MEPLGTPVPPSPEQPERRPPAEEEARAVADDGKGSCVEWKVEVINHRDGIEETIKGERDVNQGRKDAQQSEICYANSFPTASVRVRVRVRRPLSLPLSGEDEQTNERTLAVARNEPFHAV